MPRYELKDDTSNKFWEIELEDESVTLRWGRIGTTGQETSKEYDDRASAQKEYDKLVAERTRKGYVLVGGVGGAATSGKTNPELEATILTNPDDVQRYVVYSDWLKANGDIRSELIAMQLASSEGPGGLSSEAMALVAANEAHFFGDVAKYVGRGVTVRWRLGFLETVRVSFGHDEGDEADIEEILTTLVQHPSSSLLRELTIGMFDHEGENHYEGVVALLAKNGKRSLRSLHIGDFKFPDECEISRANIGSVSSLWGAFPNLELLTLQGSDIGLGEIAHDKLRSLTLRTGGLPQAAMKSLAKAKLPALERLEVWTGASEHGGTSKAEDVKPILAGDVFPKLEHLAIRNSEYTADIVKALPGSKILTRLTSLDLSMGTLGDEDAEEMLRHADAFSKLRRIDLSENLLTGATTTRLSELAAEVNVGGQREAYAGDEHRHVAVGK